MGIVMLKRLFTNKFKVVQTINFTIPKFDRPFILTTDASDFAFGPADFLSK